MTDFWLYLLILAGSTYLIRAIPFAAFQKRITNRFIRSFLYYIPYAVLAAMTFPAIFYSTGSVVASAVGLAVAMLLAFCKQSLIVVSIAACIAAFLTNLVI